METISITDAKNTLTRLIHEVEHGTNIRLTRRGKAVAVLISEAEYRRLAAPPARPSAWEALQCWRAKLAADFEGLADEEVSALRAHSADRALAWEP
jgi:prevent-host-death family protein